MPARTVFTTGHRLFDRLAQQIAAAMEPRARMLRRRRRALRWGLIFGAGCMFWVLVTALLASWTTPAWVLLITGLIAAGAAHPATLLLLRYRWLRSVPLPARQGQKVGRNGGNTAPTSARTVALNMARKSK